MSVVRIAAGNINNTVESTFPSDYSFTIQYFQFNASVDSLFTIICGCLSETIIRLPADLNCGINPGYTS